MWGWLIGFGVVMIALTFVAEIPVRTRLFRLIRYAKALEDRMKTNLPDDKVNRPQASKAAPSSAKIDFRFAHAQGQTPKLTGKQLRDILLRPGVVGPYIVAMIMLGIGVCIAARIDRDASPTREGSATSAPASPTAGRPPSPSSNPGPAPPSTIAVEYCRLFLSAHALPIILVGAIVFWLRNPIREAHTPVMRLPATYSILVDETAAQATEAASDAKEEKLTPEQTEEAFLKQARAWERLPNASERSKGNTPPHP